MFPLAAALMTGGLEHAGISPAVMVAVRPRVDGGDDDGASQLWQLLLKLALGDCSCRTLW
jgi:hypothetical protein